MSGQEPTLDELAIQHLDEMRAEGDGDDIQLDLFFEVEGPAVKAPTALMLDRGARFGQQIVAHMKANPEVVTRDVLQERQRELKDVAYLAGRGIAKHVKYGPRNEADADSDQEHKTREQLEEELVHARLWQIGISNAKSILDETEQSSGGIKEAQILSPAQQYMLDAANWIIEQVEYQGAYEKYVTRDEGRSTADMETASDVLGLVLLEDMLDQETSLKPADVEGWKSGLRELLKENRSAYVGAANRRRKHLEAEDQGASSELATTQSEQSITVDEGYEPAENGEKKVEPVPTEDEVIQLRKNLIIALLMSSATDAALSMKGKINQSIAARGDVHEENRQLEPTLAGIDITIERTLDSIRHRKQFYEAFVNLRDERLQSTR